MGRSWAFAVAASVALMLAMQLLRGGIGSATVTWFVQHNDTAVAAAVEHQGDSRVPETDAGLSLAQWAIREGGAFAVIVVILFFYRRDWKTATEFWRDQHTVTTAALVKSAEAVSAVAGALRENTLVVAQAKEVMGQVSLQLRQ